MRSVFIGLIHFVALNILSGAIVAGIDAGKVIIFLNFIINKIRDIIHGQIWTEN
jgi:hypothetical protein